MNVNRAQEIYENVVKPLPLAERLKLLELTARDLAVESPQMPVSKSHSIMELRGLGKEIWRGVNVNQYIEELRNE